jgi:triosephosphate isomerase
VRKPLVAGNWKMNGDRAMAEALCSEIVTGARAINDVEIVICPPFTLLNTVDLVIQDSNCKLGAQDMDLNENGAFTGQISNTMLKDSGCEYVILGHSERRTIYGETDQLVADKVDKALKSELIAILCVGETQKEREENVTEEVVSRQIQAVIDLIGIQAFGNVIIAYEPVWAIGTGLTATPDQAQDVHQTIRQQLAGLDSEIAEGCRILYGGSMKPENAVELISKTDIDGGLIGGAALKAEDFLAICGAA